MNVLVTGALGLYGCHLTNLLLAKKEVGLVVGVDNQSRKFLIDNPLNLIISSEKFLYLQKSYQDLSTEEIDSLKLDVIVHLAAHVSIDESMKIPAEYFINNEQGTFQLTQKLLNTNSKPILIYASSPEVYGNPRYTPMDEEHSLYPRSVYAVTKLASEKHVNALKEWYGYPVIIIRNFNTFGANQNIWSYSAVIPSFIKQSLKNLPITIHNDGKQTRDFLYVKDAVNAYWQAILNSEKIIGEVFNIGTGEQTSMDELAYLIKKLTGSNSQLSYEIGRPGDLDALSADINKIKKHLNWQPEYTLEEGLLETIKWYQKLLIDNEGKKN